VDELDDLYRSTCVLSLSIAYGNNSSGRIRFLLSIVIPTLQAEESLLRTLSALDGSGMAFETVIADGGSADGTRAVAAKSGARVIDAPRGRGTQLAAGARATTGDWLLFLHADTFLAPGWAEAVKRFMAVPENARRAGYFEFSLDDASRPARRLQSMVAWRCRRLGLPYGDQGLLISRAFYHELGGFRPLPLMEDVDLARRIGRRRLAPLGVAAVTSSRRYREGGYVLRPLRNLLCLGLYFAGLPPRLIEKLYA